MNFLVDTNLLVHIAGGPSDAKHALSLESIDRLGLQRNLLFLVPQIIYEFWAVATRDKNSNGLGFSAEETNRFIDRLGTLDFRLIQGESDVLPNWRELVTRYQVSGKTTHDAHLVASMLSHNVTHLLTFNAKHFQRFQEITVLTPEAVMS